MRQDVDKVLLDRRTIAHRVRMVARQIAGDLAPLARRKDAPPIALTLVPILTGSFVFVADLIRHLPLRLKINLLTIRSYPGATTTSRGATIRQELSNLPVTLAGQHVLVIDDILDSGRTLRAARRMLAARHPASLRSCVLLRKKRPAALRCPVDYVCFDIPNRFVVGYGLDYNDYYRNLPEIVTLKREVIGI